MQESGIFKTAVRLPPDERAAYLDQACGANPALRLEVEGLLRAHEQPGQFMHRPPIADMTTDCHPGPERPGMRVGPYKLLQFLGEGGMGTVFLAEQTEPVRRMVALKIIKPGMDSSQVLARFEAERQALALMDHPNIAKVLDAGSTAFGDRQSATGQNSEPESNLLKAESRKPIADGRPYFVMELVKGVPITEFCDKNKLSTRQRLELFIPVCNAIQHAHMKGIIHRDIKPSNVLIALYDGKPVPKVIDFGVAKAMAEPLTQRTLFTQVGQIVGTFEYMSPEQATLNQLDIDTRSDIYSLGVLLYELLTGMTPFDKDQLRKLALDQMLRTIREEEPMRPSVRLSSEAGALAMAAAYRGVEAPKLAGLLRGDLDWIVMKCLEKERNRRFVTAGSLANDIERYLNDEPVTACPPSLSYRASKAYRKNKAAIYVAATIFVLLLAGVIGSTWQAVRATNAKRDAARDRDAAIAAEKETAGERDKNVAIVEKLRQNEEQRRRAQYAWDMQIMSTAMDSGRIGQMRQLLDRHAEEQPGFEWYYWSRQIHNEVRSLKFDNAGAPQLNPEFRPLTATEQSRFVMNELGTRVACITHDQDGPAQVDPDIRQNVTPRTYYLDVYDTANGQRIGHHPYYKHTQFPRNVVMQFNRDGNLVVLIWSQTKEIAPDEARARPDGRAIERRLERLLKVIDVASGNSIYDLNLGGASAAVGSSILSARPFFFSDGKRLALAIAPPPRERGRPRDEATAPAAHVRILDLAAQPVKELCRIPGSPNVIFGGAAASLRISPDGTRLAFIKSKSVRDPETDNVRVEQTLTVADTTTGKELYSIERHPDDRLAGFASTDFSPDGQKLALVQIERQPSPNEDLIGSFAVSVLMLDAQTGKELYKEVTNVGSQIGASGPSWTCQFSPDGRRLYLTGGRPPIPGGRVWAFHADSGKPLAGFDANFSLDKFAFSPDGRAIYSVEANAVVVRNAQTGRALRTLRGHVSNIAVMGISADGSSISTLDDAGEFKVWNRFQRQRQFLEGLPVSALRAAGLARLSPNGQYVVGVPEDQQQRPDARAVPSGLQREVNRLVRWATGDGQRQPLPLRPMPELPKEFANSEQPFSTFNRIEFSADSRFVSLFRSRSFDRPRGGDADAKAEALREKASFSDLTVWDTATGQETAYLQVPVDWTKGNGIQQISRDGKTALLIDGQQLTIRAIELSGGRVAWTNESDPKDRGATTYGQRLSLSPDGRLLLHFLRRTRQPGKNPGAAGLARLSMQCRVIDPASGQELRRFDIPNETYFAVSWSPDSKRIALTRTGGFGFRGSPSNTLTHIINVESGKEEVSLTAPPGGRVGLHQVVFSPDGRRFAARESDSGPSGQTHIKVWDAADGTEMLSLPVEGGLGTFVVAFFNPQLAFSADGHRLIEFVPEGGVGSARRQDHRYATVRVIDATPPERKQP